MYDYVFQTLLLGRNKVYLSIYLSIYKSTISATVTVSTGTLPTAAPVAGDCPSRV